MVSLFMNPFAAPSSPFTDRRTPGWSATSSGCVQCVGTRDGLGAIQEPNTELVIWQRALPEAFQDWISGLKVSALPHLRILVSPEDLEIALEPLLDDCGMRAGPMRDVLVEDIGGLVAAFAGITRSGCVDVRLERIDHDACWKFHRDTVEARLVTTYLGPTTEWVPLAYAQRALDGQTAYAGPLERLGDHDVALFQGRLAGPGNGIVHRSPPIEGSGVTRLFLCLNTPSVVSPDLWVGPQTSVTQGEHNGS